MTRSYWHIQQRTPDVDCDVAVVGGGVVGASTAYWLARERPGLRLALLEAGRLADGASGRNAGFVLQGSATDYLTDVQRFGADRARRLLQFTIESRDLLFSELRGRALGLEASGSLVVAGSPEEDERLRASVAPLRADGMPVAYIRAYEANRRLTARGFYGALYAPSGAMLNPAALTQHLADESGATLLEHHPLLRLEADDGRLRLETPTRVVYAGRVVLALGAYLPRLYPALGRYVRPVRAQMLALEPSTPRWLHVPAYTHEGYYYLRQLPDGTLLCGGARHRHAEDEIGYGDETTTAVQADLETYLHRHFPQTRGLAVRHRWSGTMGFSPDHLPVVGTLPGVDGAVWATGFTGHGMSLGFRMGRLLAQRALGDDRAEGSDLFGTARFERTKHRL